MRRVPEHLTARARQLRREATRAERLLWARLSQYRPRFTRQLVVDHFIVDLACREAKLAVEVDGGQHAEATAYDARRTAFLERLGWTVVRLWNNEVIDDPDAATEHILHQCAKRLGSTHHVENASLPDEAGFRHPLPSREGRKRRLRSRAAT